MDDIFQINNWKIKKFMIVVLSIQIGFFGLTFLDYMGIGIPVIKQLVSVIYILFIPGMLFLRIIGLHETKSNIETVLFTVGSSIAMIMFIGFFINIIYPIFGVLQPLSTENLFYTFLIFTSILSVLCYLKDRNYNNYSYKNKKYSLNLYGFFLFVLPCISVVGTYLMNYYNFNGLLLLLIAMIGSLVLLICFNKGFSSDLYPLAIFSIAISLLYHSSLISTYIWGWDINVEYYFANLVINNSIWNPSIQDNVNSVLSISILAPILSNLSSISLVWIYKIVYPFLLALIPLGLYHIFKEQTTEKIAFLAAFFFMLTYTFYTEILAVTKQETAELFLVLILLLIINNNLQNSKKSLLLILFSFSLIVSHYGLSYIFFLFLIAYVLIFYALDYFKKFKYQNLNTSRASNMKRNVLTTTFIILFITFMLTWYINISNSSAFISLIHIGNQISSNILSIMDPSASQGLNLLSSEQTSFLGKINKIFYLISQLLILIGVLSVLFRDNMKFTKEYKILSVAALGMLVAGIIVPYFSSQLNTTRLFHIGLIFLAPFCIIGFMKVLNLFSFLKIRIKNKNKLKIVSIFLVIFLFFDTGFVYFVNGEEHISSISIEKTYDFPVFDNIELTGAEWLTNYKGNYTVYADEIRIYLIRSLMYPDSKEIPIYLDLIRNNSYIFLGSSNIHENYFSTRILEGANIVTNNGHLPLENVTLSRNKVYDNGGSNVDFG